MGDYDSNQNNADEAWRAWFDAWRDALAAGMGAWETAPWPLLTQAIWSALAEELEADREALAERLRGAVREWRDALREQLPSVSWLAQAILAFARMPTPQAPGSNDADGLAGMPWLGPMQHQQARIEAATEALEGYQGALAAYLDELVEIAERSVDALAEVPATRTDVDLTNPRAVFDLWCQLAEQSYEEQLSSDHYAEALSALTNRWSELKLALQPLLDDWLDTLGMPSRRQVDETQAALDRLRRQHKAETRALRERLAALETRLEEPNANSPPAESSSGD